MHTRRRSSLLLTSLSPSGNTKETSPASSCREAVDVCMLLLDYDAVRRGPSSVDQCATHERDCPDPTFPHSTSALLLEIKYTIGVGIGIACVDKSAA